MSLGTLVCEDSEPCALPIGLVKALKLDLRLSTDGKAAAGSPPVFLGPHGYKLQEPISLIYYRMSRLHGQIRLRSLAF